MIIQKSIIKYVCCMFAFTTLILTACGKEVNTAAGETAQSTAIVEKNDTVEEKEAVVENNITDDNQAIVEPKKELSEIIRPDGLWHFDHIESNSGEDTVKQAEKDNMQYIYYITDNIIFSFSNDGYGTVTPIEIDEEDTNGSPINIGACSKYRIYGNDNTTYKEAYFSADSWVTPFLSNNNDTQSYYVCKKNDPIIGGSNVVYNSDANWAERGFSEQIESEELSIKIPLTAYVDISTEVTFDHPKSWKTISTDGTNSISLSPDGNYEMICRIANVYETVIQKSNYARSREDQIIKYIQKTVDASQGLSIDDTESVLIDGRLGVISSGSWIINNITYPVKLYAVSMEKGLVFLVLCRSTEEGADNYEDDEMAMMRSVHFTYPTIKAPKIQLEDHDPDREVYLELDEIDGEDENLGLPVIYVSGRGHELVHPEKINAKAFYNRSVENDTLNVKLEISHNGNTITSDVYKMSLGTVIKFEDVDFEDDDLGIWKMRLINEDTETVLSEYYFETTYKPEETKNTTKPKIGMTAKEVEQTSWGKPDYINETKTKYGVHEQWVYEGKGYVYLDDGIVTAIQTTR